MPCLAPPRSVFAIFEGNAATPMYFPPAYQVPGFGQNIGGVSPTYYNIPGGAAYDSWLTIGSTDASAATKLSTTGLSFSAWTATAPLYATASVGSVMFTNHDDGTPCTSTVSCNPATSPTGCYSAPGAPCTGGPQATGQPAAGERRVGACSPPLPRPSNSSMLCAHVTDSLAIRDSMSDSLAIRPAAQSSRS